MMLSGSPHEFEALLNYLKHHHGCDLMGYKRSTLVRRFHHRMRSLPVKSYREYLQYLQAHPQEYQMLLNDVFINVTGFFRDTEPWVYLGTDIIPQILSRKQPDEQIRVWTAGCATGQETYSLLILLAEMLGLEACANRVQCYATDVDEDVLMQARDGIYSDRTVINIPPDWLEKYFQPTDEQGYQIHAMLRCITVFAHHDLAHNAPISKIDLLVCRNVLMYFDPKTQATILTRFHFALKDTGFLLLGKAEMPHHHRQIFTPVNLQYRIYAKGQPLELKDYLSIAPKSRNPQTPDVPSPLHYFWQTAFEMNPVAQLAISREGDLIAANERATDLFALTFEDFHRPFRSLELEKLLASQVGIDQFYSDRRPVT
ncbi:MAG: protein-glutamate O-methyltransferase CheR, partial [Synechococcales bacterium]|nr:protein-glutamate O-methyltransferase CheR [Synechococcales bacterium]